MVRSSELVNMLAFLATFLATIGLGRWLLYWLYGDQRRAAARLRDLSAGGKSGPEPRGPLTVALSAVPRVGALVTPGDGAHLALLKSRLTQAGIYGPNAVAILLGVQLLLTALLPATAGVLPWTLGLLSGWHALLVGLVAAGVGVLTPGLWVYYQRSRQQNQLLRALPDTADMLVLCVEAGLSLNAALQRVTGELQIAHPALARELNIIQREIQLGLSIGDAMKKFGDRSGLDEVRQLAAVIQQAERYGTSSVKALRLHSETCRQKRHQRAEEKAQKAAVKIVFPTLLCIFPAIFIVILGPAAYQIAGMFAKMK